MKTRSAVLKLFYYLKTEEATKELMTFSTEENSLVLFSKVSHLFSSVALSLVSINYNIAVCFYYLQMESWGD